VTAGADAGFPDAWYLSLSSRLVPDLDGGYTIAALARARQMADAGAGDGRGPLLLSVDPAPADAHTEHRAEFVRRGMLGDPRRLRNLFDEAVAPGGGAAAWLRDAAVPGEAHPGVAYRDVAGGAVSLPVIADDPDWHLSAAPVVVRGADGSSVGVLRGFGALYRAWLDVVVAGLRDIRDRPVVVIVESRQLGELLTEWADPGVRLVHAVHTIHLEPPYAADAPVNALWSRWFAVVDRFDAVLWPTPSQRADVEERFGASPVHVVAPHGVSSPAATPPADARVPGRVVVLGRLAPGKRLDLAVLAFARVAAAVPSATLELWGEGAERDRLEELVGELGLERRVSLPGRTASPGSVLAEASVYLSTSAFEGQGLALAEALAHGTPAVVFDIRYGPRDTLAAGGGILVPDDDLDALAEALERVLTDDALRARLSAEAFAAAEALAPAHAMRVLSAAIRDALARPSRRA
jgi:poly(glycerol-phosphate) alpha-glucosyltransferase